MSMATSSIRSSSLAPLILVVNHKPPILKHFAVLLDLGGYKVETAISAQAALERLQRPPMPNLVLLDVAMPGSDGLETLQRARTLHPDLKVVMMGAVDDSRRAAQAVRMGALDYLPEPFHESELRSVLTQHLLPPVGPPEHTEDPEATVVNLPEGTSFVCASSAMRLIHAQAALIAKFD